MLYKNLINYYHLNDYIHINEKNHRVIFIYLVHHMKHWLFYIRNDCTGNKALVYYGDDNVLKDIYAPYEAIRF